MQILWSKKNKTTSVLGVSNGASLPGGEAVDYRYPFYILETWDEKGSNKLEPLTSDEVSDRLLAIDRSNEEATRERTGDDLVEYPYVVYSVFKDIDCADGMGRLPHLHIHSYWLNVIAKGVRPWEPFVPEKREPLPLPKI